ncbi:MAG: putative glutamine amidotransferase [Oceanicoccus sp.]|jgi:putative glutamine amidotransferase
MPQKPIIAILTAQTEDKGIFIEKVSRGYTLAIHKAGGIPIILPNLHDALEHYLPLLDGLLIVGGKSDVHPSLYGEEVNGSEELNLEKDQFEMKLIKGALEKGAPIFGICRGMQMLNVYFGGTLKQHVEGHFDRVQFDKHIHELHIQNSRLTASNTHPVNSIHHQVVNKVGPGLKATGLSCDGHIEMIEHENLPIFGTQWHPECLPNDQLSKELFKWLVENSLQRT